MKPSAESKKSQIKKFKNAKNELKNKSVRNPEKFRGKYKLHGDAEVDVTIVNLEMQPVREFRIPPGFEGARSGNNSVVLWDGRDQIDEEVPPGRYFIIQRIKYKNGEHDVRVIPVEK